MILLDFFEKLDGIFFLINFVRNLVSFVVVLLEEFYEDLFNKKIFSQMNVAPDWPGDSS